MSEKQLQFDEVMTLLDHIGQEERHFNTLELEYRKLASQWLLVSLGAIGFVLSGKNDMLIPPWILVFCISVASSLGILIIWVLDLKVYHELLHAAFKQGVQLEKRYAAFVPQIRAGMVASQTGGDVIKRVILYYFFSILILATIANIAVWFVCTGMIPVAVNLGFCALLGLLYHEMTKRSERHIS